MNSELQIGLTGAGVAVVLLIVVYNKWQERKHRKHAERAFKSAHRDVLLEPQDGVPSSGAEGERREPGIDDVLPSPLDVADVGEIVRPEVVRPVSEAPVKRGMPDMPEALDPRVDCVIRVEAIEALEASRLWAAQAEQLDGLSKPVRWFAFDDGSNLWRSLNAHSAGAFHWFCAAMQLVDRRGPIGEADFLRFSGGVQRVADRFLAVPAALPARAEALGSATELDRFCADVDVQIGINVITAGQPFSGTKLRGLAEARGMVLADDGSFHARDDHGNLEFALSNLEPALFAADAMRSFQTSGITFVIDVPRVSNGSAAFDRMMDAARQFADTLGGTVVDDNRAPFGTDAAAMIRRQIAQFQERMASRAIPAGGELAKRLFAATA